MEQDIMGIKFRFQWNVNPPVEDLEEWRLLDHSERVNETSDRYASRSMLLTFRRVHLDDDTVVLHYVLEHKKGLSFLVKEATVEFFLSMANLARVWHFDPQGMIYPGLPISPQGGGFPPPGTFSSFASAGRSIPALIAMNSAGNNLAMVGMVNQIPTSRIEGKGPFARKPATRPFSFSIRRYVEGVDIRVRKLEEGIFISRASVSWFEVMKRYAGIVDEANGFSPKSFERPLYGPVWGAALGLWDELTEDDVRVAARKAKELGVKAIMLELGWDTPMPFGMDLIGDGTPNAERFPHFRQLVDEIHEMGLNLIVNWFPFVIGSRTRAYPEVSDSLVVTENGKKDMILCPRCAGTRDYAKTIAKRIVDEFGIDGLWVDDVESVGYELVEWEGWKYKLMKPCIAEHNHAWPTNADGVEAILREINDTVTSIKPQAMIVFRRQHGNINAKRFLTHLWPPDNAFDYNMNRRECIFMRSYSHGVLVEPYCDCWAPEEPPETLAKRLMSQVLTGVPTVSFDFEATSEEQLAVIRTWFEFYNEHFMELNHGDLRPLVLQSPEYALKVEAEQRAYVGYFQCIPGHTPLTNDFDEVYLLNATSLPLYTHLTGLSGEFKVEVFDFLMRPVASGTLKAGKGRPAGLALDTPDPAMVRLTRT